MNSLHAVFKVPLPELCSSSKRGIVLVRAGPLTLYLPFEGKYNNTPFMQWPDFYHLPEDSQDPVSVKGLPEACNGHETQVFYSPQRILETLVSERRDDWSFLI